MAVLTEPASWLVQYPLGCDRSFGDCQELERLGVLAYQNGDLHLAHFLIDRIRRIGVARADLVCLKADLLARLGLMKLAEDTLDLALELDPDNVHANSRLLGWSEDADERVRAAEQLIRLCPTDERMLGPALRALSESGKDAVASGQIVQDDFVGWVAWNGVDPIRLQLRDGRGEQGLSVASESSDAPMATYDHFARLRFSLHADGRPVHLSISAEDAILFRLSAYPAERRSAADTGRQPAGSMIDADLTVILPIYNDFEATRDCLDSLRPQLAKSKGIRAVLVNDASPDNQINRLLDGYADDPGFTVLHNDINLGFAGAVNRALSLVTRGDVLLLNADTVLPAGAIDELMRAARSSPDIGTVTPLSNNGEYTSFPEPFRANDLPSIQTISDIDRAAKVNRDVLVDLPNGIGFCLYITRRCLNSVGDMPHLYDRGYYEDVEFCLRARENGLRNVCAPWIYVGHAGSRSFGAEKRSLVMRNLKKLKDRFPTYNNESVAFAKCDPLREARGRIEAELLKKISFDKLIVAPDDLAGEVALDRAQDLTQRGSAVLVCILATSTQSATFRSPRDGYQSLQFGIGSGEEKETLVAYIAELSVARFEFSGSSSLMIDVIQRLKSLRKPSDIFIADDASLDLRTCLDGFGNSTRNGATRSVDGAASSAPDAGRYIAPNQEARAFLTSKRIRPSRTEVEPDRELTTSFRVVFSESRTIRCGVILDEHCPLTFQSLVETMRRMSRFRHLQFFVLGSTLNDDALMALGNVFVLGPTKADEIATLAQTYRFQGMLIYLPRQTFAWRKAERAREIGLPVAHFAWPSTSVGPSGSLRLDPSMPPDILGDGISSWLVDAGGEASNAA